MPSYEDLVKGLTLLSCGVGSGAAYRLYCQSLHRKYFALFAFLCFQVTRSFLLLAVVWWLPHPRNVYAWTWVITQPLIWLFYIFVALELYSRVLQNYKGLQTVGRWVFFIAVTLAILISGASMLPTLRNPHEQVQVIFYYALVARGIMFSLVLFILLILFFLSWYPITLSRNLVVHSIICTLFFISVSMGYLVRNVEGSAVTRAVNISHLVITIICMSSWMLLLSGRGEGSRMTIRREWTPEEEKRLVDQLTAINSSLMRATQDKAAL
jgi:hypothetical protein